MVEGGMKRGREGEMKENRYHYTCAINRVGMYSNV